jgi:hypothetical protein
MEVPSASALLFRLNHPVNQSILRFNREPSQVVIQHLVCSEIEKKLKEEGRAHKRIHGLRNGLRSRQDLTIGTNNRQENVFWKEGEPTVYTEKSAGRICDKTDRGKRNFSHLWHAFPDEDPYATGQYLYTGHGH